MSIRPALGVLLVLAAVLFCWDRFVSGPVLVASSAPVVSYASSGDCCLIPANRGLNKFGGRP